ncbi:MAG TPA: GNAT family N-acetyltransferase [candidate division Zixibacteria bacterium]|nr:GNAT family N-acetyltransferase [candidate division Zixibacteria bacterium]
MIRAIEDFAPEGVESGVGLAIQDEAGRYQFFLAGSRHLCPPGELFYAGIGGHREQGETWRQCAEREAMEEIGVGIRLLSSKETWHIPTSGPAVVVELTDELRPLALYEMIHPEETPRAGELYRLVVFLAQLQDEPEKLPPEEVSGILAMTSQQVIQGLDRKSALDELLLEGAKIVLEPNRIDRQTRLYPLGTAVALARVLETSSDRKQGENDGASRMSKRYSLRQATNADYDFLYHLKTTCLKEYVAATWGWDEEYQQGRFAEFFDPAATQVVVVDGRDVGQLSVEDKGEELFLAGIYLLPDWQNRGLGTEIIQSLLSAAEASGQWVSLQVLRVNPARSLYERLGFRVLAETDTHLIMHS